MKTVKFTTSNQNLFCPVTGKQVISDSGEFTPSSAMTFCYVDMTDEFIFATKEVEKLCVEAESFDDFASTLNQENWLCLYLFDQSGEGIRFCFDMEYQEI